jgi:CysZ protein
MNGMLKSFPIALRMIFKDPVNFSLALVPSVIALAIYLTLVTIIFNNYHLMKTFLAGYLQLPADQAGWAGVFLTAILILFVFVIMSFTFVMLVGLIGAPFNSMLSSRIEDKLAGKSVNQDRSKTFGEVLGGFGRSIVNELKKILLILVLSVFAFFLNFIPVFYPVAALIFSLLIAVQFVDYSWSRHDWTFGGCFSDVFKNIVVYGISGAFFLVMMTVPLLNVLVPPLATSYYTVLWLHRQNKIPLT